MSTVKQCQARVPSLCRIHGNDDHLNILLHGKLAIRNLNDSQALLQQSKTVDELQENRALVQHDQLVYDATMKGLTVLRKAVMESEQAENFSETLVLEKRLAEAVKYRKTYISLQKTETAAENIFRQTVSTGTQIFPNTSLETKLPFGTPVAVRLKNGSYIYDKSGKRINGNRPNLKQGFPKKPYLPFITLDAQKVPFISLQNANYPVQLDEVSEIYILPSSFNSNDLVNPYTVSAELSFANEPARWAFQSGEYYYELPSCYFKGNMPDRNKKMFSQGRWGNSIISITPAEETTLLYVVTE